MVVVAVVAVLLVVLVMVLLTLPQGAPPTDASALTALPCSPLSEEEAAALAKVLKDPCSCQAG